MNSAADKLEEIVLAHPNPEEIWNVSKAIEALTTTFQYQYAPSYIHTVLIRLSANRSYLGHRSIFRKINKDAFKLLPKLIEKRKRELEETSHQGTTRSEEEVHMTQTDESSQLWQAYKEAEEGEEKLTVVNELHSLAFLRGTTINELTDVVTGVSEAIARDNLELAKTRLLAGMVFIAKHREMT